MPSLEKAKKLAEEIYEVFKQVEAVIPQLSEYPLGAKDPSWLSLIKGEKSPTIRDYILLNYAKDQQHEDVKVDQDLLLTCALSFDIVSSAKHFDVDHFFPQSEMMEKLNKLVQEQHVLKEIKSNLLKRLFQEQKYLGKKDKNAQSYADKVVNRLIPLDTTDHQLKVTGLRHIYYNCPANLWPISGPVNRSKGKRESIETSISFVFKRIYGLLGEQQVRSLAVKTAKQFKISSVTIKIKTKERRKATVRLLSNSILQEFNKQCEKIDDKGSGVLPFIRKGSEIIFMLEFFQKTPIGDLSKKFASETAVNAKQSLGIARDIAYHAMIEELVKEGDEAAKKDLRSHNQAAQRILKILHKSLRSSLDQNLKKHNFDSLERMSSSDSSSSADSIKIKAMEGMKAMFVESTEEQLASYKKRKRSGSVEVSSNPKRLKNVPK